MSHTENHFSTDRARPHEHEAVLAEGVTHYSPRTVWVRSDDMDVDSLFGGRIVRSTHPLSDWCLRRHDSSEPIPTGTTLEIVETRTHGAMVRELPQPGDLLTAPLDLQADGLFEVGS